MNWNQICCLLYAVHSSTSPSFSWKKNCWQSLRTGALSCRKIRSWKCTFFWIIFQNCQNNPYQSACLDIQQVICSHLIILHPKTSVIVYSDIFLCSFIREILFNFFKNSNDSVARDAHSRFISKRYILPDRGRLVQQLNITLLLTTLACLLPFLQHILKNTIFFEKFVVMFFRKLYCNQKKSYISLLRISVICCLNFCYLKWYFWSKLCTNTVHWILRSILILALCSVIVENPILRSVITYHSGLTIFSV